MRLITDISSDHQHALILSDKPYPFAEALLKHLKKHDVHASYESSVQKTDFSGHSYVFVIKNRISQEDLTAIVKSPVPTLIVTNNPTLFANLQKTLRPKRYHHIKTAHVDFDDQRSETIENIMWFFLSKQSQQSIDLHATLPPTKEVGPGKRRLQLTRKQVWKLGIMLFLFIEFFFILPLLGTGFFIYKAGAALRENDVESASRNIRIAEPLLATTQASYTVSRPALLFVFLSLIPENIISIEENSITFIKTTLDTQVKAQELTGLILKTGKTTEEINTTRILLSQVNNNIAALSESSGNLKDLLDYPIQSVKSLRKNFEDIHTYLETLQKITNHSDDLIGGTQSKKYLFFFYNNMELRPGGGFIGSFAIVEFQNYSLYDFQVYDVYDADGQLKAHVEPPRAIREHLDQPNWFLRDSNFTPDFAENVKSAEFFLNKELELGNFDGYVGITTTGLTYLLEAFGDVYIPDFNENVNADNFYLKAQLQSEGDFFPGSTNKKSYLSTIGRTLMLNVQDASPPKLAIGLKKAFDEKHIVFLSNDPRIQQDIDSLRWSGKVSLPQCLSGLDNCIINHIFSIDANLGVNKANYFVNKSVHLQTDIDKNGEIHNILSTTFVNTSPSSVFPGGPYKNYYQIYLPTHSDVATVEINGNISNDFDETSSGHFKIIGILVETEPKDSAVVNVEYTLTDPIEKGTHSYQLVVQKQIGAFNNDFSFELNLPDNIFVTNQNFASLAKKGRVVYNTDLSTDRIFVIDMVRE